MTLPFGLIGAGGFGREVMPYVTNDVDRVFVTEEKVIHGETLNGFMVERLDSLLLRDEFLEFNIAIANSAARMRLAELCLKHGATPRAIKAPDHQDLGNNITGPGAILCANTMITSNVKIGRFFHLNIYSYVAHDCIIGDYVTFAPSVKCNGNVIVEDHAYIGTGAIICPGSMNAPLTIGRGACVGMGAVVTKNVLPGCTVIGNPARPIGD